MIKEAFVTENNTRPMRIAGIFLSACALTSLVLLAIHPGEGGKTFAEALRAEAAAQAINGIVHGGYVALLSLELAALAVLAQVTKRPAMTAGLALFGLGVVALSASLLIDGLVLPAIAAKYLAVPDKIEFAKSLFVLCGTFIKVLMPLGLMLQAGGILFFGIAQAHCQTSRVSGGLGIVIGAVAVVAVGMMGLQPIVVMASIAAFSLWFAWFGLLALRARL